MSIATYSMATSTSDAMDDIRMEDVATENAGGPELMSVDGTHMHIYTYLFH